MSPDFTQIGSCGLGWLESPQRGGPGAGWALGVTSMTHTSMARSSRTRTARIHTSTIHTSTTCVSITDTYMVMLLGLNLWSVFALEMLIY